MPLMPIRHMTFHAVDAIDVIRHAAADAIDRYAVTPLLAHAPHAIFRHTIHMPYAVSLLLPPLLFMFSLFRFFFTLIFYFSSLRYLLLPLRAISLFLMLDAVISTPFTLMPLLPMLLCHYYVIIIYAMMLCCYIAILFHFAMLILRLQDY